MIDENYLNLLEYKNFLSHFNDYPFTLYNFALKPTLTHISLLPLLKPCYYNSFYTVSLLKTYFLENKKVDDIQLIQRLSVQIFENYVVNEELPCIEKAEALETVKTAEIDQKIEIYEIKKLLIVLNDFNHEHFTHKIEYITKSICIIECLSFDCKLLFLEAFVTLTSNIVHYKNVIREIISFFGNTDISSFLNDHLGEDDLNLKIDYLEVCLYVINTYLEGKYTYEEVATINVTSTSKTILEDQVDKLYMAKMSENDLIDVQDKDFAFSQNIFDEMYGLLTTSQILENDLFVIFKYTFSIYILSYARRDECLVDQIIGRTMSSKEFMIRENLMVDLQLQIIRCIYYLKNHHLAKNHLRLILNSNAISFLTKNNRERVISCLNTYEILYVNEKIEIIRRAFFNIRVRLEEDKTDAKKFDECIGLLCVFLEYIAYSDSSAHFMEINNYFTSLSSYEQSIEYYADFLSRNNFEAPLWTFLRNSGTIYIIKFYMSFFKKVKRNFEQRRMKYKNEEIDYSVIIDKHVTNFCKILLERKEINLVNVLNAIPYLPQKPEYFAIYFHVWRFIFDNDAEDEMLFFKYKTPALVNLSLGVDASTTMDSNLLEKVYKFLITEHNNELFNRGNIQKHYSHFVFVLILYIEYEKIRNYMFDGVYEYLQDTKLLKTGFESLMYVMVGVHYSFNIKYDKLKEYIMTLLNIFISSYDSTKRIIFEIVKLLVKNEEFFVFDLELNIKYNECIKCLKTGKKLQKRQIMLDDLIDTYKVKFLNVIKDKAKVLHDYLIITLCDVSLFSEFRTNNSGIFSDINASVTNEMEKIFVFVGSNNYKAIYDNEENFQWLIDVVYMNKYDSVIIRRCITLLKVQLKKKYCLEKLYVLLKIYNIMGIREEESELYLKKAIYIPLDFTHTTATIQNLYEETTGFHRYYFSHMLFLYAEYSKKTKTIPFPAKKEYYEIFTDEDIIFIHNMFKKKVLFDYLADKKEWQYLSYFYNKYILSLLDIVSILRNSKEKDRIGIALQALKSFDITSFVPQFVQCLKRKEIFADVFLVLHELCVNEHVCHFLLWNLKSNVETEDDIFTKCIKDIESSYEHKEIADVTIDHNKSSHKFLQQISFFNDMTRISSLMMPYLKFSKDEKLIKMNEFLNRIQVPVGIYLPTDVEYEIVKVVKSSGKVLQSHAKVPFMASFYCVKRKEMTDEIRNFIKNENIELTVPKSPIVIKDLIFKAGDDCKQDMLAIQLISMFKDIFDANNIDLFLFPYQVIATGPDTGIIEVIPNAITRDQMGREKINNLVDYFEYKFGFRESETYTTAVYNFTRSFAAYSLVTYFLNIKDRHNGNIMIDKDGHIIHIDFGYMFEISPGNFNLEIPIKLTHEIHNLLISSEMYDLYVDLMLKGFFVLRRNSKDIVFLVDSFKDSGLSCYRKKAVDNFIDRFKFNLTDDEAKIYVVNMINNSIKRMRTWAYDKYQEITNNIAF